jgi:hypothetical protein
MNQIEQIEVSLEDAKQAVALRDAVLRLEKNRDFKKLIEQGYLTEEAVRLTHLLAHPAMAERQDDLITDLKGISAFKAYIHQIMATGNMAEVSLKEHEEALDELRAVEEDS